MMWQVAVAFLMGMAVAEYYNRGRIDQIRREQLEELRAQRRGRPCDVSRDNDYIDLPPRRQPKGDLISKDQYNQMREIGRTGGKRVGGATDASMV